MSGNEELFRSCGSCGCRWSDWQDFVCDLGLRLLGVQAIQNLPQANLIVFEHKCGSSVSVLASKLRHLIPEDRDVQLPSLFGTDSCRQHCLVIDNLALCDRPCINARDRRLAQLLHLMRTQGKKIPKQ